MPQSDRTTPAGHLINLALHSVASRMQQQVDPRMSALKTVSSFQSLHVGDISKYKWGGRQPVRRRRGDVHGDMSLLAVRLQWAGGLSCCLATGHVRGLTKARSRLEITYARVWALEHSRSLSLITLEFRCDLCHVLWATRY